MPGQQQPLHQQQQQHIRPKQQMPMCLVPAAAVPTPCMQKLKPFTASPPTVLSTTLFDKKFEHMLPMLVHRMTFVVQFDHIICCPSEQPEIWKRGVFDLISG